MIRPDPGTEVVDNPADNTVSMTVTLADDLDLSDADVFPEWEVVSTKTLGDYTLTLYTNGRVLVTLTATGAAVRDQAFLQAAYSDFA